MLIDRWMPNYDVSERHERDVPASTQDAYDAVKKMDLAKSLPIKGLFLVRGIPHFLTGRPLPKGSVTLDSFLELGFVVLEEEPGEEIVLGAVGKFWLPTSGIQPIAAEDFLGFNEAGNAKATMNLRVESLDDSYSKVITETRVASTDEVAARKFGRYWMLVGPFSSLIRREMLRLVEEELR